jgi:hypothetical protein
MHGANRRVAAPVPYAQVTARLPNRPVSTLPPCGATKRSHLPGFRNGYPAMHQLLVLTVDADQTAIDSTIVIKRGDGSSQTFHYVDVVDNLLHYRNEALSEEDARRLIA